MLKAFKFLFGYKIIAIFCATISLTSILFLQGTNTGEDMCIYTTEKLEKTYVQEEGQFEPYNPDKHSGIKQTYIRRGQEGHIKYFPNNPNWRFMGKPCILTRESYVIFISGYAISFSILFSILGAIRIVSGKVFSMMAASIRR